MAHPSVAQKLAHPGAKSIPTEEYGHQSESPLIPKRYIFEEDIQGSELISRLNEQLRQHKAVPGSSDSLKAMEHEEEKQA